MRARRPLWLADGSRRGAVLVVALACLAVSAAIVATMARGAMTARRVLRTERDLRQVEQLLDAGAAWAVARTQAGAETPDTLTLGSADIAGHGSARIGVALERIGDGWRMRVAVEYPLEDNAPIRRSRDVVVPAPNTGPVISVEE